MNIEFNLLFEVVNILFALLFVVLLKKYFGIEDAPFLILLVHFAFIFLTNNVLFPISYMGDQFAYFRFSELFRRGIEPLVKIQPTVYFASKIFAFFPVPLINSVFSLAIVNFIIYCLTYVFLKKTGVFTRYSEYFYLLYPSLALYSALALRDTMILFFMILFFYFLFRKKYLYRDLIFAVLSAVPLVWLKNQNALLLLLVMFVYILLNLKKYNKLFVFCMLLGSVGALFFFQRYFSLQNINYFRFYFYFYENPERFRDFRMIHSWQELLLFSVSSLFSFVLEPLPWKAASALQLIQSFENIGILAVCAVFLRRKITGDFNKEKFLMIFYFILALTVYGLIIINYGTAARYRFPFIVTFFIFYSYCGRRTEAVPAPLKLQNPRTADV